MSSKLLVSDSAGLGLEKLLDELVCCQVQNKDMVVAHDDLYTYVHVLSKLKALTHGSRWDWDGNRIVPGLASHI